MGCFWGRGGFGVVTLSNPLGNEPTLQNKGSCRHVNEVGYLNEVSFGSSISIFSSC
jgi:hypothetical protein